MLTDSQILFLNRACPYRWTEHDDIISVLGDVNIFNTNLTEIPVQFGNVTGHFDCQHNKLTSLKGSPLVIHGSFNCSSNQLSTLKNGPKKVNGYYACERNLLTNLIGAPKKCYSFYCERNLLTSLKGCPRVNYTSLWCTYNPNLHVLYGLLKIRRNIYYDNKNDLNEWIIEQSRQNIIVTHKNIVEWIKQNKKYLYLRNAPKEIRRYFSKYFLNIIDANIC